MYSKLAPLLTTIVLLTGCAPAEDSPTPVGFGNFSDTDDASSVSCENVVCDDNAACGVWAGVAECICDGGWEGDGTTCSDVDECAAQTDNCDASNGTCWNTPGDFECGCHDGWYLWANGSACIAEVAQRTITSGDYHTCRLDQNGHAACWGENTWGQSNPPVGTVLKLSAGDRTNCMLEEDKSVYCWGMYYPWGFAPAGSFEDVATGYEFGCGLTSSGTVSCWGMNEFGQGTPPSGTFKKLSAGTWHVCGIRTDDTVECWGLTEEWSWLNLPGSADTFLDVSSSTSFNCGIKTGGTIQCWGTQGFIPPGIPEGTFQQLSVGAGHGCAVSEDDSIVCWGGNASGQATPPAGTFEQVSAGGDHSCGITTTGETVCWGLNTDGQCSP